MLLLNQSYSLQRAVGWDSIYNTPKALWGKGTGSKQSYTLLPVDFTELRCV